MANVIRDMFLKSSASDLIAKVTIRQKYGNHTLAYLDYLVRQKKYYSLPKEHTPVKVNWGTSPLGVSTFYGYVNHYETYNDSNNLVYNRLVALGTSKVMNSTTPTNWPGTTRSSIAREIAERHKLRSIIHEHPYIVDNWASGTRTDLQILQDIADESGYNVWVDGSTLYFLDPRKILQSAATLDTPTFGSNDVRQIKVTGGAAAPINQNAAKRRIAYGLDSGTNELFVATGGDPKYATQILSSSVNTYGEAESLTDAISRKADTFYTVKLVVTGNSKVMPGTLVNVSGNTFTPDQTGLWMVAESTHEVSSKDFSTTIIATRPASSSVTPVLSSTVRGIQTVAPAVIRDGAIWEAQLQEHING